MAVPSHNPTRGGRADLGGLNNSNNDTSDIMNNERNHSNHDDTTKHSGSTTSNDSSTSTCNYSNTKGSNDNNEDMNDTLGPTCRLTSLTVPAARFDQLLDDDRPPPLGGSLAGRLNFLLWLANDKNPLGSLRAPCSHACDHV